MDIELGRIPAEDSHVQAWVDFSARLRELGKKGYNLTHATDAYIILQK